jgi:hypothetical protein
VTTPDAFAAVLAELSEEHGRAVAVHGFDEAHDDRHSDADWSWRLLRRVTEVMAPETVMRTTPAERRRALFECAHIAASAVAAHDRRSVPPELRGDVADVLTLPPIVSTSTDDSWRYVARPPVEAIEAIERHTLTCAAWRDETAPCRGVCTEEPPT